MLAAANCSTYCLTCESRLVISLFVPTVGRRVHVRLPGPHSSVNLSSVMTTPTVPSTMDYAVATVRPVTQETE